MHEKPVTICEGLLFPEGPVALRDGSIALVEMARGTVSRVGLNGVVDVLADVGGGPNGLAAGPDGCLYVCNNGGYQYRRHGDLLKTDGIAHDYEGGCIQRVDPATGNVQLLYSDCDGVRLSSPNDIAFDFEGGFYFTDIGKMRPRSRDRGGIYYAAHDGSSIREVVYPMLTPNGLALSADRARLIVADTESSYLWQFEITGPGVLKKERYPFFEAGQLLSSGHGVKAFDGIALDEAGNIYAACISTGEIVVISPSGQLLETIPFPDRHTTNICFDTNGRSTAYVTQSHTGKLLQIPVTSQGLPLPFTV